MSIQSHGINRDEFAFPIPNSRYDYSEATDCMVTGCRTVRPAPSGPYYRCWSHVNVDGRTSPCEVRARE
jgi:hypothetical protein